ncbi:MAG: glycosyltransferase family 4 protein [Chthoniobacterales bacterium]
MILLAHPTANQNVRHAALAFAKAGLLGEFWTCVNWQQDGLLDRALAFSPRLQNELRRRSFPVELGPSIRTHPWREWGRHVASQLGLGQLTKSEHSLLGIDAVYLSFTRRVARRLSSCPIIKAVYAYDHGALEIFRAAKQLGITCIYEHPVVYWRKVHALQREEAELHPEWTSTLGALKDSAEKLERKDEELSLADLVVVPSEFSRDSLSQAPGLSAPIQVVPYGAPPVGENVAPADGEKLRVLFVGGLSQAKGLGYLLEAAARLGRHLDLTLVGQRISPLIPKQADLDRHRWIPSLPHDDLVKEMSHHDVLVLPSLHEGLPLVIPEAMAQGLVVIATPHAAGPSLIEDGVNGFIVPIRSASGIEEKLELLLQDRPRLMEMKRAAQRHAAVLSWETYRQRLAEVAREAVLSPAKDIPHLHGSVDR